MAIAPFASSLNLPPLNEAEIPPMALIWKPAYVKAHISEFPRFPETGSPLPEILHLADWGFI